MILKNFNWYKNYLERLRYLQESKESFTAAAGFSFSKISQKGKNYLFKFEYLPLFYFGASSKLKSHAKKYANNLIDFLPIYHKLEVSQRQVYKLKVLHPFGYYVDLRNAYSTILYILGFIPDEVFNKLLEYKKRGHNINRILGFSYLGNKIITEYYGGNKAEERREVNPLNGIFHLAKYFVLKMFGGLYFHPFFRKIMVARFIDCAVFTDSKYSIEQIQNYMREVMVDIFIKELKKINEFTYSNAGKEFFELLDFKLKEHFYHFIQFNVYSVSNIKYEDHGNTRILTFYIKKDGKDLKRTYRSGALTDSVVDRYTFNSSSVFKDKMKDYKNQIETINYIDIYQYLQKHGIAYELINKGNSYEINNKFPIFEQKFSNFIEDNYLNFYGYEKIEDIKQQVDIEF